MCVGYSMRIKTLTVLLLSLAIVSCDGFEETPYIKVNGILTWDLEELDGTIKFCETQDIYEVRAITSGTFAHLADRVKKLREKSKGKIYVELIGRVGPLEPSGAVKQELREFRVRQVTEIKIGSCTTETKNIESHNKAIKKDN